MAKDSSKQSIDAGGVQHALAEIRASAAELQSFIEGLFDRLDEMADRLRDRKAVLGRAQGDTGRAALDDQIDRLAALAAELAESVAEQKKLTDKINSI